MLSNATNQPKSTVEPGYMCPRGLLGPPATQLNSFRYNIQLIAQLVGRQRFVPTRKFMSPSGDMNFLGGTNLHVSRLTGQ